MDHDIEIRNEGTIFLFTPVTKAGKNWVEENLTLEDWQWFGQGFSIEHRYAADLAQGMQNDGLTVI